MREAVVVAAVRTPVGKCGGTLAPVPVEELGALAVREAVKRARIDPAEIDEVIFSNIRSNDVRGMARMVALLAGIPVQVPGITLDRACASSLNAFAYASLLIQAGHGDVMVAGGVESDSRAPYVLLRPTAPYQVMPPSWGEDRSSPNEPFGNPRMGITAENVAQQFNIQRKECDEFALSSHQKASKAWDSGYFDDQVIPVTVPAGKGKSIVFSRDECIRADTSLEALGRLSTPFKKDGVVTAGNSCPMNDGAAAIVVMEKGKAKSLGLPVMAKFSGYAAAGVDPRIMGTGPVAATRKLFAQTGMTMKDVNLVELNEAFAPQSIACVRELGIDREKLNVNGGAIALGHPLAATGAVLITKMVYEFARRNARTGLITFCVGGGQGVSVVLERE